MKRNSENSSEMKKNIPNPHSFPWGKEACEAGR